MSRAEDRAPGNAARGRRRSLGRAIAFRLIAVGLGLSVLPLIELALVVLDVGTPPRDQDPFIGFASIAPLFVLDAGGERWEIPESRQGFFCPDSFAARKPPRERRVFCLGGSTVHGRPWTKSTSFASWLELALEAAEPESSWRVVNCGGVSYASYRLVPILEEVLRHEPDLIVVYTGHNEFLEERTYGGLRELPDFVVAPAGYLARTRIASLVRSAWRATKAVGRGGIRRAVLPDEVDAVLDHRGGLEAYHRDPAWRADVVRHFRHNLARMARLAREAGVPLLLVRPVANLRDCPPFKSEHGETVAPAGRERVATCRERAAELWIGNRHQAVRLLEEARRCDPALAVTSWELARGLESLGRHEEARAAFAKARELDICPLRAIDAIDAAIVEVAAEEGAALVDARSWFESHSEHGVPGGDWLVDHVHPTVRGHQEIARLLFEELEARDLVRPVAGHEARRERVWSEHLASLPASYWAHGRRRLDNLRRWAAGRAGPHLRPPSDPRSPSVADETSPSSAVPELRSRGRASTASER